MTAKRNQVNLRMTDELLARLDKIQNEDTLSGKIRGILESWLEQVENPNKHAIEWSARELELIDALDAVYGETRDERVRFMVRDFFSKRGVAWAPMRVQQIPAELINERADELDAEAKAADTKRTADDWSIA